MSFLALDLSHFLECGRDGGGSILCPEDSLPLRKGGELKGT